MTFSLNYFVNSYLPPKLVENKCMKMNNLTNKCIIVLLVLIFSNNLLGQDRDNPWVIGFGVNAVDFYPTNSDNGGNWFSQFLNRKDHYNYVKAPSKLSLGRYLNESFNVEFSGSVNKITKIGNKYLPQSLSYLALDLNFNYDLNKIIGETGWFDPYALLGGGLKVQREIMNSTPTINSGLGAKFWFNKKFGIRGQSVYKHTLRKKVDPHFQHSLSLIYKFGGYDEDNDGVYDKDDKCPSVFGLAIFEGCPDTDEDGIADSEDGCPDVFGVQALKGCPDTDGDGVADKFDNCQFIKGSVELKGCPDSDGDGIIDQRDACPTNAGPISNQGCPEVDSDGDGIIDKLDKCKFEVGPSENQGCPIETKELEVKLNELSRSVLFISGSDKFYLKYESTLNEIAELMKNNNNLKFEIRGHTDNVGPEEANLKLSLARVNKLLSYLVSRGVNKMDLNVRGMGELEPIESNYTAEGRAKNRRVEIKVLRN